MTDTTNTTNALEPVYKTARFTAETSSWAFQGFSGYINGRLPTSDEDLLRLGATGEQPGDYVFVSYLSDKEFGDLFAEDADGFFSLRDESVSLVTTRELSVPA